jgi:hypothetical protein
MNAHTERFQKIVSNKQKEQLTPSTPGSSEPFSQKQPQRDGETATKPRRQSNGNMTIQLLRPGAPSPRVE